MGCHITSSAMARTWLHRNASLQTQLSAPAKLSDLTHSYGQNITVLSRQPTDSKVSALANVCILATVAMARSWLLRQEHLQMAPVCTGDLTQWYHSLAKKAHSPRVLTEKNPTYSTLPYEELRRITSSVLARRNTISNIFLRLLLC